MPLSRLLIVPLSSGRILWSLSKLWSFLEKCQYRGQVFLVGSLEEFRCMRWPFSQGLMGSADVNLAADVADDGLNTVGVCACDVLCDVNVL